MTIQNQDIYAQTITTFNQMLQSKAKDSNTIDTLMQKLFAEAASLKPKELRYVRKKILALENLPRSYTDLFRYVLSIFFRALSNFYRMNPTPPQANWVEKLNIKIGEQERLRPLPAEIWGEIALYARSKDSRSILSTQKSLLTQHKKLLIRDLGNQDKPFSAMQLEKIIQRFPELRLEVKSLSLSVWLGKKEEFAQSYFPELEELSLFFVGPTFRSVLDIDSTLHPKIKFLNLINWGYTEIHDQPPHLKKVKIDRGTIRLGVSVKLEEIELGPTVTFRHSHPLADKMICHINFPTDIDDSFYTAFQRHSSLGGPKHFKIRLYRIDGSNLQDIEPFKQKLAAYLPSLTTANEATLIYRRPNEETDTVEKLELTSQNFKF